MPLRIFIQIRKALLKLFDKTYNLFSMRQEYLSPVRQCHRLVAVNKLCFELLLKAFDLGRNRRLGQVEQFARLAEAHRFGDGNQRFKLTDIHGLTPFWPAAGCRRLVCRII
ncbi:hypothetical protein D3C87_1744650 [compost metagenome]